ncbi:MAG: transposase [Chloroflexi bacterium]|nr:transposase [Chloroflexota bacterium]
MSVSEHGLLVALGGFAQQVGVPAAMERVAVPMKTVEHSPGEKLTELLVHLLGGGQHVNELERSPQPLVADQTVARAWGQARFASASGVNAVLRAATSETVSGLKAAVRQVLEPYRRRVLREVAPAWLVVDCDLTGLVVSDQATTYEGADFGYMGEVGGVGRGYQFARAQLQGRHDPLLLGGFLHAGRTISAHCLAELVASIEAELGRPRRRVELIEQRLAEATEQLADLQARLARRTTRQPGRGARLQARCERTAAAVATLAARRTALLADNAANPTPRRILLRLDGGFGTAALLAWLYEQGYDFVARAHSGQVAATLQTEPDFRWEKISQNGWLAESQRTSVGDCPYPMRVFASRQWWGDARPERWSALLASPSLPAAEWSVRRVGVFYNGRQTIEATTKEGKGLLASRQLPTRHQAGIAVYQQLVLFAQNLLRWFRRQCLGHTPIAAAGLAELVRIGAHSPAVLHRDHDLRWLQFTGTSPWRGLRLAWQTPLAFQLWFPFLDDYLSAHYQP